MDRPASWRVQRIDLAAEPRLEIGGATIDPVSREAIHPGGTERIQPQNLKVLFALARRRGEVVTRTELIEQCWNGRIVGEDVINHAISTLRAFASKTRAFAIETVPKAGYRLVERELMCAPPRSRWRPWMGWALAMAVPAALLVAWPSRKPATLAPPLIALRPFDTPPDDAAAADLARATRAAVAHMLTDGGLPVRIAATDDADADFVMSGEIDHVADAYEVSVRLQETRRDTVIFSHRFEADEARAPLLPDQVGASMAANLSWGAALMILDRRHPTDPAIMSEQLKQLSILIEGGDMLRSYAIARELARKAPNSPMTQIGLAFNSGFVLGELPRDQRPAAVALGRAAADRARILAPDFGDSYIPWCLMHGPMQMARCDSELRAAMRTDPDAPSVTGFLSELMSETGQFEDALLLARQSFAKLPFLPAKNHRVISALLVAGNDAEAQQVYDRASRWWPNNRRVASGPIAGYMRTGDLAAIVAFAEADPALRTAARELIAASKAGTAAARSSPCARPASRAEYASLCFVAEAGRGEIDAAFALAVQMYPRKNGRDVAEEERLWLDDLDGFPLALLSVRATAPLRRDPRFVDLAMRTGLLTYWRARGLPDFCRPPGEPVCARLRG